MKTKSGKLEIMKVVGGDSDRAMARRRRQMAAKGYRFCKRCMDWRQNVTLDDGSTGVCPVCGLPPSKIA